MAKSKRVYKEKRRIDLKNGNFVEFVKTIMKPFTPLTEEQVRFVTTQKNKAEVSTKASPKNGGRKNKRPSFSKMKRKARRKTHRRG
jgi:hypothetical protein